MNTARENAESFNELAREVEIFPRKVAAALRLQVQNVNLFNFVWGTIKQCVALERVLLRTRLILGFGRFCIDLWRVSDPPITLLVY